MSMRARLATVECRFQEARAVAAAIPMPPGGNSATARPSILYVHTARALVGAVPRSERNGVPRLVSDLVGSSLTIDQSQLFRLQSASGGIDSIGVAMRRMGPELKQLKPRREGSRITSEAKG